MKSNKKGWLQTWRENDRPNEPWYVRGLCLAGWMAFAAGGHLFGKTAEEAVLWFEEKVIVPSENEATANRVSGGLLVGGAVIVLALWLALIFGAPLLTGIVLQWLIGSVLGWLLGGCIAAGLYCLWTGKSWKERG